MRFGLGRMSKGVLTHSTSNIRDSVRSMTDTCRRNPRGHKGFQDAARDAYSGLHDTYVPSLEWLTWTCDTDWCVTPAHLETNLPTKLHYPYGVCIYCGLPGWTKDHLLPRSWTGDSARKSVVTVPACGECNSLIGDSFAATIRDRRDIAQSRLCKKHRRVLSRYEYSEDELSDFGHLLRSSIVSGLEEKRQLESRLAWPHDPFYDARALETSDIPYAALSEVLGEDSGLD